MKMTFKTKKDAFKDMFRMNRYKLVDYSIQDGKKHKVAIIVPGGGYSCICGFVEGSITVNVLL